MHPSLKTAAVVVSASTLLTLAGCAGSGSRSHASTGSLSDTRPAHHAPLTADEYPQKQFSDELVIGTRLDDDGLPRYRTPVNRCTIDQIRAELEEMFDIDQELVTLAYNPQQASRRTVSAIRSIDRVHCDRLKEIVEHIGWPTRELVGLKATQGAYMVIQHAGHDIEFQNRCLAMMVDLVEQGELPASYVALLTDRIRVFQDRPQVFGTQMTMNRNEHGIMVPFPTVPIEDPEHLNDRRKLMGMGPHEDFIAAIQIAYDASISDPDSRFAEVPTDY